MLLRDSRKEGQRGDEKIKYCRPTIKNLYLQYLCSCVRGTVWLAFFLFYLLLLWNQFIFAHMATIPQDTTGLRLGSRDPYAFSRDDALSDV